MCAQRHKIGSAALEVWAEEVLDCVGYSAESTEPVSVHVVQGSASHAGTSRLGYPTPAVFAVAGVVDNSGHNSVAVYARRPRSAWMCLGDTVGQGRQAQSGELLVEVRQSWPWPAVAVAGGEFGEELQTGGHRGGGGDDRPAHADARACNEVAQQGPQRGKDLGSVDARALNAHRESLSGRSTRRAEDTTIIGGEGHG